MECREKKGVPFKSYIYVPENHPLTGEIFCEREDEGHVLKVLSKIVQCIVHSVK